MDNNLTGFFRTTLTQECSIFDRKKDVNIHLIGNKIENFRKSSVIMPRRQWYLEEFKCFETGTF